MRSQQVPILRLALASLALLSLVALSALADETPAPASSPLYPPPYPQPYPAPYPSSPPPPPAYPQPYPPPYPPVYVSTPPGYLAPPPTGHVHPLRIHPRPEPWIRPRPVRANMAVAGFGTVVARQDGGVEYLAGGGGISLRLGLELGRIIGIEARYGLSFHNPIDSCFSGFVYAWCDTSFLLVQTLGVDLKLHIPTNARVIPYFAVGPMVGWIGRQGHPSDAIGGGFEAGGGFDVWLSRHGTIGFEVLYRGLRMADFEASTGTRTYLSLVQIGGVIAAVLP